MIHLHVPQLRLMYAWGQASSNTHTNSFIIYTRLKILISYMYAHYNQEKNTPSDVRRPGWLLQYELNELVHLDLYDYRCVI